MTMRAKAMRKQKQTRERGMQALFARANEQWEQGNLRSAHRLLLLGAKQGDTSAQHNLGYFYDAGVGVRPNRSKALHWYKLAYRRGSRVAASNIASIFRDEGNTASALEWYQRAARLHDGDANLEIAKLLIASKSEKESVKYLKRTINAASRDATQAAQKEAQRLLTRIARQLGSQRRRSQRRRVS